MSNTPNKIELALEKFIFSSRWLLVPFFLGLIVGMAVLLIKFFKELWMLIQGVLGIVEHDTVISILTLVDTALIAVLLLIIVFSAYENFVSKLSIGDHEDRPAWMGKVGFSDLKMKLIGAIVAISAVELLKAFLISTSLTSEQLKWKIAIHLTFVVSGLLFALADWISDLRK
ncbi:MAG: TIGR00645 family protein [Hydrogenophaga sp.]|uniref:TIGR00645 family protein n=1 Tax=Hydrogenophaga sp. TaxID=1904254 RepID=UPI002764F7B1|nr:TIGR00645 family protein [Hydrogenophaga sp.]MDP2419143.1 TIGR00645 family protein [Hydrogenophaga sp.]MDZ4189178.1 TIGR00645 family protein [Hydrogenophaga sp.]